MNFLWFSYDIMISYNYSCLPPAEVPKRGPAHCANSKKLTAPLPSCTQVRTCTHDISDILKHMDMNHDWTHKMDQNGRWRKLAEVRVPQRHESVVDMSSSIMIDLEQVWQVGPRPASPRIPWLASTDLHAVAPARAALLEALLVKSSQIHQCQPRWISSARKPSQWNQRDSVGNLDQRGVQKWSNAVAPVFCIWCPFCTLVDSVGPMGPPMGPPMVRHLWELVENANGCDMATAESSPRTLHCVCRPKFMTDPSLRRTVAGIPLLGSVTIHFSCLSWIWYTGDPGVCRVAMSCSHRHGFRPLPQPNVAIAMIQVDAASAGFQPSTFAKCAYVSCTEQNHTKSNQHICHSVR